MMKIITTFLILGAVLALPAQAYREADKENLSEPAVHVIKKYVGHWRGWEDGCKNCYKPMATERRGNGKSAKNKEAVKKLEQARKLLEMQRRNYCECTCKTPAMIKTEMANKESEAKAGAKKTQDSQAGGANDAESVAKNSLLSGDDAIRALELEIEADMKDAQLNPVTAQ